jgi:hypothetical protein
MQKSTYKKLDGLQRWAESLTRNGRDPAFGSIAIDLKYIMDELEREEP